MTGDQVQEMVRLRVEERLTQRGIADRLGVGMWSVKRNWDKVPEDLRRVLPGSPGRRLSSRNGKRRWSNSRLYTGPMVLPMQTLAGVVWCETVKLPKGRSAPGRGVCDRCGREEMCLAAVRRGDFVACERPLAWEVGGDRG